MLEKKLSPEQNWLTILPIVVILGVVVLTISTALSPGQQPRAGFFDILMRIDPRTVSEGALDEYAIINIDQESLDRQGPWPWPRTELAELVNIAREAGAKSVVLTVPVEGSDPLSPEIVGRYWFKRGDEEERTVATAISKLPSHDVALAQALQQQPSAIAVGAITPVRSGFSQNWGRSNFAETAWVKISGATENANNVNAALPVSYPAGELSLNVAAASTVSVSALPTDPDGIVRRIRLLWNVYDQPAPATALAALILRGEQLTAGLHQSLLQASSHPVSSLTIADNEFPLDRSGSSPVYLPQNITILTVPAWRTMLDNDSWREELSGRIVFIGESVTGRSIIRTARGPMPRTNLHVLMANQLSDGTAISRPEWSGIAEAATALMLGVITIALILLFSNAVSVTFTFVASTILAAISWLSFVNVGIMFDPLPAIIAMVGSQLAFGASGLVASVIRDDVVRGAFHGALPPAVMAKIQKTKNPVLLRGIRRQVTVLSCSVRLPNEMLAKYVHSPDEYIEFRAQTNDKLRQSILNMGGTVDFGEDGRLLGYWNVPEETEDHIERACTCALQMIEDMNTLARDLQRSQTGFPLARIVGEEESSAFEQGHLEVGISSEVCFSGPVGRSPRNRYSAVGPAVALANNLRNRSRLYGPAIVCDETVFTALRHHLAFLDLDTLRINDQVQPTQIYGLVGNPFLKASKTFRRMADLQRELVNTWRDGELEKTAKYLEQLENVPGIHEAYISLYRDRLNRAKLEISSGKQADSWDGSQQIYL